MLLSSILNQEPLITITFNGLLGSPGLFAFIWAKKKNSTIVKYHYNLFKITVFYLNIL